MTTMTMTMLIIPLMTMVLPQFCTMMVLANGRLVTGLSPPTGITPPAPIIITILIRVLQIILSARVAMLVIDGMVITDRSIPRSIPMVQQRWI